MQALARRAAVRRALALERVARRSPCGASALARSAPPRFSAWPPTTCWPPCSPTRSRAPRTWPAAIARCPTIRSYADPRRLPGRGDGYRRAARRARAHRGRRDPGASCRELDEPSPLAHEILNAKPLRVPRRRAARGAAHASRAVAPLPDALRRGAISARSTRRRSRACATKRGRTCANADELHDALVLLGFADGWRRRARGLRAVRGSRADGRATPSSCARRRPLGRARTGRRGRRALGRRSRRRLPALPAAPARTRDEALRELVRGRLEALGPVTADELARRSACRRATSLSRSRARAQGFALRGRFTARRSADPRSGASAACSRASIATR